MGNFEQDGCAVQGAWATSRDKNRPQEGRWKTRRIQNHRSQGRGFTEFMKQHQMQQRVSVRQDLKSTLCSRLFIGH